MKACCKAATMLAFVLLSIGVISAQEREDRTLLNWDQMRAIINEASGERAMHHVLELVPIRGCGPFGIRGLFSRK